MDESRATQSGPRYKWPWFALAAVIAAFLLGFIWMNAAVERLRRTKQFIPPPIRQTTNSAAQPNPGSGAVTQGAGSLEEIVRRRLVDGNGEAGRKVFFEKPEANCAKCHRVDGQGGEMGPPLDGIGSRLTREALLDALLRPNARTIEGYESVIVLLKNGSGEAGLLKKETDSEMTLLTSENLVVTLRKEDLQIRQRGLSPMPEGLAHILTQQDLLDLIEFMAALK